MAHLMELHPDFLPQDANLDRVKAGDHANLAKVAEAMQEIWSFHYAEMPGRIGNERIRCWLKRLESTFRVEVIPRFSFPNSSLLMMFQYQVVRSCDLIVF